MGEEEEGKKKNFHDEGCGSTFAWFASHWWLGGGGGMIFQPNFHSDYFPKSKILFHARRILSP